MQPVRANMHLATRFGRQGCNALRRIRTCRQTESVARLQGSILRSTHSDHALRDMAPVPTMTFDDHNKVYGGGALPLSPDQLTN